jgi:hypothetical protein
MVDAPGISLAAAQTAADSTRNITVWPDQKPGTVIRREFETIGWIRMGRARPIAFDHSF